MPFILPFLKKPRHPRDRVLGPRIRKAGQTVGSHIADRVALRKIIMLCIHCESKFDRKSAGYVRSRLIPIANGRCDGCQTDNPCKAFLHRESHQYDPLDKVRQKRAADAKKLAEAAALDRAKKSGRVITLLQPKRK